MNGKQLTTIGGLITSLLGWSGQASAQKIDVFEQVADNGSIGKYLEIPTNWGGHQPRIVRHNDGSIRLVYLSVDDSGLLSWNLMRRGPVGGWTQEAKHQTNDDVTLVRHPDTDTAHVLAWPASVPTVYTSPGFAGNRVSGTWPDSPTKYRQYTATGMAADGSALCLKVEFDENVSPPTSRSHVRYSCATYNSYTSSFDWMTTEPLDLEIRYRYNYDYLHINPAPNRSGMYGVSKRDLRNSASNVPNASTDYVKNGLRSYRADLASNEWSKNDFVPEIYAPPGATSAPEAGSQDAFIDSKGRLFSAYNITNPAQPATNGNYVYIADADGGTIYQGHWNGAKMESYGTSRFYEDGKGRLWLLWENRGNRAPEVLIYPIIETQNPLTFSLGTATNLAAKLGTNVPDGFAFYIAAPRGGNVPASANDRANGIDAIFHACSSVTYDVDYSTSKSGLPCYGSDNSGHTKIFYAHIKLPD